MRGRRFLMWAGVLAVGCGLAACSAPADSGPPPETVAASVEPSELVRQMSAHAWAEEVEAAQMLIEEQRPLQDTASPEWLVAVSWLGRGASFAEQWDVAEQYAQEAYDGSVALLADRELDAGRRLPLALGAAIEVLGRVHDARGHRDAAIEFLEAEHARYLDTSMAMRIQKNILLLSLEGEPFPVLDVEHHLGPPLPSAESLRGKVVVAFFWAHWCGDCKQQEPILEQLHDTYADRGLVILGPTQLWGYTARGTDATPDEELAYLRGDYQEQYPIPSWMSVPVSQRNFLEFGVSTTPTLVVIDREGIVQLYNPGNLSYEELAAEVERLLA